MMQSTNLLFRLTAQLCVSALLFFLSAALIEARQLADISITDEEFSVIRILNTENGMPGNSLSMAIQDSDGFIWAATFNGLVRFDGNRVHVYNTSNTDNLESNRFTFVREDQFGRIWAGLEHRNILMIDGATRVVMSIDEDIVEPNTFITEIFINDRQKGLAGTNNGVLWFENETFTKIEELPGNVVQQIFRIGDETHILFEYSWYKIDLDTMQFEKIAEYRDGVIYFGENQIITEFDKIDRFWNVHIIGDQKLLIHEGGVLRISDGEANPVLQSDDIGQHILHGILYHNNEYYLYGTNGLLVTNSLSGDSIELRKISNININSIISDHEGSLWASTSAHGLYQFVSTPVYQGNKFRHIAETPVTAILEDRTGTLWTGTNCAGLYAYTNNDVHHYAENEGIQNLCVWSVLEQTDGTIWAGTWGDGVYRKAPGQEAFTRFLPPGMEEASAILSIFEDSEQNIWFGSFDRGLFKFDGEQLTTVDNESGGRISAVRTIFEDANNLLVATDRGIGIYHNGKVIKPDEFNQLSTRNFRVIKKDADGRYWFGSYGGGILVYAPGGDTIQITTEQGLVDDTVSQIEFDEHQNIWLAGNMGIFFIEKDVADQFLNGETKTLRVARLGVSEGLPIRETTGGFKPSSHINADGELFIPMVQGLAVIHTNRMQLNREVPNVFISEIEKDGEVYSTADINEIEYDTQRIVFRFTVLSFKNPDNVQFQYKLEGFDSNWQNLRGTREAAYTTLSPGEYHFRVRASNNDGFWNEEGAEYSFTVSPPFWQTTWFILIVLIVLSGIILLGYRYRLRNIKNYNMRLQREVAERTEELARSNQELKDLIEEKNKLHRVLAHDLRNPFTAILGYIELLKNNFAGKEDHENQKIMEMLLDSGQNTLNLLENLLQWTGTKHNAGETEIKAITAEKLIDAAISMTGAQAQFKNIKIKAKIPKNITVFADENMILTVLRNLISNAIKFSGRGETVTVKATEEGDRVIFSVKDNGVGMPETERKHLFSTHGIHNKLGTNGEKGIGLGLQISKEFVERHSGTIWAQSEPGKGSTFYFTLKRVEELESEQRS